MLLSGSTVHGHVRGKNLFVHKTADGSLLHELQHSQVVHAAVFITDELLAIGGEVGTIGVWNVSTGKLRNEFSGMTYSPMYCL